MIVQNTDSMSMDLNNSMLDMKQLFFNNLQLLGFDAPAMEATNRIPFNKTMFELPNKRGAEIVLHYLFQRLNPTMCREAFRDCWPILDKKREQGYRKTCSNWLTNISQEEPDSHLPRINASLFMSPGGEKFYQLLFHFSGYVLRKVLDTELGSKTGERLKYPVLTSQNLQLGDVIIKDLTCSSIRHRTSYFSSAQLNVKASKTWKDTADEYVKEYRKLNKEIRELDYKVRDEEQKSVEASVARGSPGKRQSGQSSHFDPEFDPRTIKRAQRFQQVRDMWKELEDFDRTEAAEREVVESIVERTINKHRLDAADISVKVPDMLLRECGDEIRRRNVDNTYQGGKLNLVSVLQLWNLCLHLYLEKVNEVGVPKFEEEVKKLTSQVHVQQNYAQNARTLRQQMSERIPVLKSSIEKLRGKLDAALFEDKSPESIRTTVSELDDVTGERVTTESVTKNACGSQHPLSMKLPASNKDYRTENRNGQKIEILRNTSRHLENQMSKCKIDEGRNKVAEKEEISKLNGRKRKKEFMYAHKNCEVKVNERRWEPGKANLKDKELDVKTEFIFRNLNGRLDSNNDVEFCKIADRGKVSRERSVADGSGICMECGARCVCGQTAVAIKSDCQSPNTSSVAEPSTCHSRNTLSKLDSPDSLLNSSHKNLPSQSGYVDTQSCNGGSIVFTSHVLSDTHSQKITREKVQEFEQVLRSHHLHPDSFTAYKLNYSGVEMNPLINLSVTGQSGSSGYMSYKNSEVSSLPDHSQLFDEHSSMAHNSLDVGNTPDTHLAGKHTSDLAETSPFPNISGLVTLTGKKFQPLKDMHIDEKVPLGGVLSTPRRQVCSLKSCLPLKDMTQEEVVCDKFDTTLHHLNSVAEQQSPFSPPRKFSPLKDMSISEESENQHASLYSSEEIKSKVYKYVEPETDPQFDDVITLCTVDLDEGKHINGQTDTDFFSESPNEKRSKHSQPHGCTVRDFPGNLRADSPNICSLAISKNVSDRSYHSVKKAYNSENTNSGVLRSYDRSGESGEVVNEGLRSIQVKEAESYKFYRSPKGTLKRVRFCFPD